MSESDIHKAAVIGTGFMGTGIAQVMAMAGLEVMIHDSNPEAMTRAVENMRTSLKKLIAKEKFAGNTDEVLARIRPAEELAEAADRDLVIESVYESIPVKEEILEGLGKIVRADAVIGSNTSSIPLEMLSEKVPSPERFLGMHFFVPVPLSELIELVMGPATSEAVLEKVKLLARRIEKNPIVVRKPSPGFLVNRIFFATAIEAMRCYAEGVGTPEDIDTGMCLGYGWKTGPFEILDLVGLDIMAAIFATFGLDPPPQIQEMLDQGYLGRKTGRGFYRYGPDGKKIKKET